MSTNLFDILFTYLTRLGKFAHAARFLDTAELKSRCGESLTMKHSVVTTVNAIMHSVNAYHEITGFFLFYYCAM